MACRSLLLFSLFLPVATFVACTADESGPSSSEDTSNLIGGRAANATELPSTLLIKGNCTASKVGPRHILTAAHCVTGAHTDKFAAGKTIEITAAKAVGAFAPDASEGSDASSPFQSVVIEKTEVQPAWRDKCATMKCLSVHISGRSDIADAAVIVTRDELVGIPEAAVDLSPVAPGDRVAVTGYGCEDAVGLRWNYANQRLKIAETQAVPFDRVVHPGSFIYPEDRDTGLMTMMAGHYVITPGTRDIAADGGAEMPDASPETRGGLCPGDSGGPLYRLGGDVPVVVGINANYTFPTTGNSNDLGDGSGRTFNYGGTPITNWHTRLDLESGHRVGAWLRDLGARTACTRGNCE